MKKTRDGDKWQTLKVMGIFALAVLALAALQFAATRAHQAKWQIFDRTR
jgi:uncharacterized membrane protein SirB2